MHRFQIRTLSFVLSAASSLMMAGQSKTLAELTRESPMIVLGHVASANSYVGADEEIYTDVAVRTESVLKDSEETGPTDLRFTVRGGTVGDRVVIFSDVPRFEAGEEVVVFGTAERPVEKFRLDPTRGRDLVYQIQQSRGDAGESIPEKELERAREFLRTLETGTRERGGGVIELDAVSCSAYTGPKWATPATTYVAGPNLPATWAPVLQAAAQSWTGAGSKFGFTSSASSPHIISLGDLGAGSTLASTRSEYSVATKQMVRFSMTFNNRFTWTTTGETGKFDVQAIATHELGHALGLNHPPDTACSEETMWASAGSGETKKRSLEAGDKTGVATLYGSATAPPAPAPAPPTAVPAAPVISYFSLVTTRAVATKPLVILAQGSNIDPAKVQGFFIGGACGTAGCVASPYGASSTDVVFINTLPAGAYTLAIRNGATGALSVVRPFTVNAN